jgi:CheY-like chemotaxis protein
MNLHQGYVLIVEDEPDSREVVQAVLRMAGIEHRAVPSGEEALRVLEGSVPSLILIDLALPGMNGWSLLQEIQRQERLAPVRRVAVTAYHNLEVAEAAIDAGFDAYFPKPLDAGSFVRELQSVLAD